MSDRSDLSSVIYGSGHKGEDIWLISFLVSSYATTFDVVTFVFKFICKDNF